MKFWVTLLWLMIPFSTQANLPSFPVTPEWLAKMEALAPDAPAATPKQPRKALVFSLMTGFKHWVTPHTIEVVKILGKKTGAYDVVVSDDIAMFEPENIKQFDVIIINNTCSDRKKRNLFFDVTQDEAKAAALEESLLAHIHSGHGLAAFHGAITMLNQSAKFSDMLGGSFDSHPAQQEITCTPVPPPHPITAAFGGKPLVHFDEPYFFNNAYKDKNFRPLLEMHISPITEKSKQDKRYVSWIKRYGEGRVFYCSPSHNAQSFDSPELLQFMLNGIQYAAGDLECDDRPMEQIAPE